MRGLLHWRCEGDVFGQETPPRAHAALSQTKKTCPFAVGFESRVGLFSQLKGKTRGTLLRRSFSLGGAECSDSRRRSRWSGRASPRKACDPGATRDRT